MKRALAFLAGVCLAAAQACAEPAIDAVDRIVIPVSELGRAAGFYTGALSFVPVDAAEPPGVALRLGKERSSWSSSRGGRCLAIRAAMTAGSSIWRLSSPISIAPTRLSSGKAPHPYHKGSRSFPPGTRMPVGSAPFISAIRTGTRLS